MGSVRVAMLNLGIDIGEWIGGMEHGLGFFSILMFGESANAK